MTKKNSGEGFKRYIEKRFETLMNEHFILDFVHLQFIYHDKQHKHEFYNGDVLFSINYEPVYHQAVITVYGGSRELYKKKEYEIIDHAIIHEISHVHTTKVADVAESRFATEKEIHSSIEELTEIIARYVATIINLKNKKHDKPRKQ